MTTFLLTISLLLNGIAIYFIFILYSRQNRFLEVEKTQESFKEEIENEISAFLLEMKEDNEELIRRFQELNKTRLQASVAPKASQKSEHTFETVSKEISGNIDDAPMKEWEAKASASLKKQAVKVYQKTIADHDELLESAQDEKELLVNKNDDPPEQGNEELYRDVLLNQVKILQSKGLTINEIAQKLNKGKKEIELLLKFN